MSKARDIGALLAPKSVAVIGAAPKGQGLRGRILEIGGVKEKTLAAHRAGIHEVVLPAGNARDLRDVPQDVRSKMRFQFVEHMDEVFDIALTRRAAGARRRARTGAGGGSGTRNRRAAHSEATEAPDPADETS